MNVCRRFMESSLSIFECIGTMNRLEEPWFLKKPVKCLLCFLSAPPRLRVNFFPQVHEEFRVPFGPAHRP